MTTNDKLIIEAERWMHSNSSSMFCARQARIMEMRGDDGSAIEWALKSLAHSRGIMSREYNDAATARSIPKP